MDGVDEILAQWAAQMPGLDVRAMGPMGRLARLSRLLTRELEQNMARFGLSLAGFDVLATLLRAGPPHCLSPGELLGSMMVTSGTVTSRVDQLEAQGLVKRSRNPADARGMLISLTPEGMARAEAAVAAHAARQAALLGTLEPDAQAALDAALRHALARLETGQPPLPQPPSAPTCAR